MKNERCLALGLAMLALILVQPVNLGAQAVSKVDLNQATIEQLDELPGVGPAIAKRIVDYRQENGPFKRIEDLMNVRGIGEKTFLKLKDRITVSQAGEQPPAPQP
jgi:comEA protein